MSMNSYIAKRLFHTILIAWGVMTAAFFLMRIGPHSPADKYLATLGAGHNVSQVTAAIESRYGVDRPLYEQYFTYISSLLHGDWGWSFTNIHPIIIVYEKLSMSFCIIMPYNELKDKWLTWSGPALRGRWPFSQGALRSCCNLGTMRASGQLSWLIRA